MTRHGSPAPRPGGTATSGETDRVLEVEDLTCSIATPDGPITLVDRVSFSLTRGETLGVVGESGSGKTMLVRSIMGIQPRSAKVTGRIVLNGVDLLSLPPKRRRRVLGSGMGMVFQNPLTSLNPVVPIGRQITEGLRYHHGASRGAARARAIELLDQVGISEPAARLKQYPQQLSGGQRQRVIIASALACDPDVLIADEATTALDVTVQKQILDLIAEIQVARNMSVVVISHDLGVVYGRTSQVAVMYSGQVAEFGATADVFARHRHQYTAAMLESIPEIGAPIHTRLATIAGSPRRPSAENVGCGFADRCPAASDICHTDDPAPVYDSGAPGHWFRCHWPTDPQISMDNPDGTDRRAKVDPAARTPVGQP